MNANHSTEILIGYQLLSMSYRGRIRRSGGPAGLGNYQNIVNLRYHRMLDWGWTYLNEVSAGPGRDTQSISIEIIK